MSQPVHGDFTVTIKDNIVYSDYSQGFNAAGIEAIFNEVLRVSRHHKRWAMLQRPEESAGLTPDAAQAMYQWYLELQHAGCQAVGIVDNSMFVHAVSMPRDGKLTMAFKIDKDEQTLMRFLQDALNSPSK